MLCLQVWAKFHRINDRKHLFDVQNHCYLVVQLIYEDNDAFDHGIEIVSVD